MRVRFRSVKFWIVLASLLGAWIVTAPLFAKSLIARKALEKPDAMLVLAGSAVYKERNKRAAELFKEGVSEKVILTDDGRDSGWSESAGRNLKFVELAKRELVSSGVPEERIVTLTPSVAGTIDEARLVVDQADRLGVRRIMLVTSAYHSARALNTFEKIADRESRNLEFGMDPVAPGVETPSQLTWWLSIRGWRFVGGELIKSVYYWIFV